MVIYYKPKLCISTFPRKQSHPRKCFKWSVTRDYRHSFFYDSNPHGPLINSLKYFRIRFQFRGDFQIFKKLCSVHHPAESDSAVCIIQGSQAPRCAPLRGVKLQGVHHTVGLWKKVSKNICGVYHTAESVTCPVSVISLWCLKTLLWKLNWKLQIVRTFIYKT